MPQSREVFRVLHSLRALSRRHPVVFLVLLPAQSLSPPFVAMCEHLSDTVLQLDAFNGERMWVGWVVACLWPAHAVTMSV